MKLLYCVKCDSIIRLVSKHRECECWKCGGKYTDSLNAIYYWDAFPMWIDNNSFSIRINKKIQENIYYNTANKLEFDSSDIKCFAFWKWSWCAWWNCGKTMSKLTKKEYKKFWL